LAHDLAWVKAIAIADGLPCFAQEVGAGEMPLPDVGRNPCILCFLLFFRELTRKQLYPPGS